MKLKNRILLNYFLISIIPILTLGFFGGHELNRVRFDTLAQFYEAQLYQIDKTINTMITSVEYDIKSLSENRVIKDANDAELTSFLSADENEFKYNIGSEEEEIIGIFSAYKESHPYINSVYMGRKNGSFVRSHKRPRPTKYDPRERPWYKLALAHPDRVMRTKPYMSVTSDDVNIGIVKALNGSNGKVLGVIGADITLDRFSRFMSQVKLLKASYVTLVNSDGIILTNPDREKLFRHYSEAGMPYIGKITGSGKGSMRVSDGGTASYLFYYTSPEYGWRICALVPEAMINKEAGKIMLIALFALGLAAVLSAFIAYLSAKNITGSFDGLMKGMRSLVQGVKEGSGFKKIGYCSADEINELAEGFNNMGTQLIKAYTELDDNYRRIEELNRLKTVFISMVSHELRTPLTIIKGSAALLPKAGRLEPKQEELAEAINNNVLRLQFIIEDLLDLSKIESGVFAMSPEDCDIKEIADRLVEEGSVSASDKNIRIVKQYGNNEVKVRADCRRIKQALTNILNNAVKFSHKDSEIMVDIKKIKGKDVECPPYVCGVIYLEKDYVVISVKDTGVGIRSTHSEKIFEKFFQVEDINIRKYQGAGVGLSISKSLVELHGGMIWVYSGGPGKGSVFYVLLPAG